MTRTLPQPPDPTDPAAGRYVGHIAGVGTASGTRLVVGRWASSPLGAFADVMVEHADGTRLLLAPHEDVAAVVGRAYRFDDVRVVPVHVHADGRARTWTVLAGPLAATLVVGGRTPTGRLLGLLPRPLATSTLLATVADPVARVLLPGVRTHGTAGGGLREWYGASDQHAVVEVDARWDGEALGPLADVDPPVRFGFSSAPPRPCVTRVTTTLAPVRAAGGRARGSATRATGTGGAH